jgi:hypothetical protein
MTPFFTVLIYALNVHSGEGRSEGAVIRLADRVVVNGST